MKPIDYSAIMDKMVRDPAPISYADVNLACSDKPFHDEHRLFYRMTAAKLTAEGGLSHGAPAISEQHPLVICATCGAQAYPLYATPTGDSPPNTKHYTPGELVIPLGPTGEYRKRLMMIVVGYTSSGRVKTRYVYEAEAWWRPTKALVKLKDDEFYDNPISALMPANNYTHTKHWLESMPADCPDYNFEPVFNVFDLAIRPRESSPILNMICRTSLDECLMDYNRRHPPARAVAPEKRPKTKEKEGDDDE